MTNVDKIFLAIGVVMVFALLVFACMVLVYTGLCTGLLGFIMAIMIGTSFTVCLKEIISM